MVLGHRDTSDLISMISFAFDMQRHFIQLTSASFTSYRLANFGWVPFANLHVRSLVESRICERRVKATAPFYAVCALKFFTKFWDNVANFLYFQMPLPDCLCRVLFWRYSRLSLEVVEELNQCKRFLIPSFWEGRPRLFYGRLLARFTFNHLAKFRWVSFAGLRLRSLAK